MSSQLRLVSVGLRSFDGQDNTIGDDSEEDGVFEGRPFNQELGEAADDVALPEDEKGGGALLLLLRHPFPPPHPDGRGGSRNLSSVHKDEAFQDYPANSGKGFGEEVFQLMPTGLISSARGIR